MTHSQNSKNWTFFFWSMIQRIELFFFEYDSQNQGLIFSIWLKELNVTQSIESSFFNLTQRIEPFFSVWLEDLTFLLEMSHRIKPFWKKKKKMTRWIDFPKNINQNKETFWWFKEVIELLFQNDSKILLNTTQRIELFFVNMTPRIDL